MKAVVIADSITHARLLCQYKYGMDSIAVSPVRVDEAGTNTLQPIKPKPPLSPQQARIQALKQTADRSKEQLHAERENQHRQREAERTRQQRLKR